MPVGNLFKPWLYRETPGALNGCLNDVACLQHLLKTRFGYLDSEITMLKDEGNDPQSWPTRANMLSQMRALVAGQVAGDFIFFSFSGEFAL
jgi:hypothetical protein